MIIMRNKIYINVLLKRNLCCDKSGLIIAYDILDEFFVSVRSSFFYFEFEWNVNVSNPCLSFEVMNLFTIITMMDGTCRLQEWCVFRGQFL
jgi:hypothetical protein